jgi:transcriptional regulator with XRE-family HTH domain
MASKIDLEAFGKRIAKKRNELNMSQADLAKQAGVTRQYLSFIEAGERGCSLDVLVNISVALNERLDQLVFGKWKRDPTSVLLALQEDKDFSQTEKDALHNIMVSIKNLKTELEAKRDNKRGFFSK